MRSCPEAANHSRYLAWDMQVNEMMMKTALFRRLDDYDDDENEDDDYDDDDVDDDKEGGGGH